jgi:hypothetical protein
MSLRSHRGSIAWIFLLASLPACSSWKVSTVPPAELLTKEHPAKIRVTLADNSTVVLSRPELVEDTLVGHSEKQQVRIATSDAVQVARRKTDALSTVGLIGGFWLVAFVATRGTCDGYC